MRYGERIAEECCDSVQKTEYLEVLAGEPAVFMLVAHKAQVNGAAKLAVRLHRLQNRRDHLLRRELRARQQALRGFSVSERRRHVGEHLAAAALARNGRLLCAHREVIAKL